MKKKLAQYWCYFSEMVNVPNDQQSDYLPLQNNVSSQTCIDSSGDSESDSEHPADSESDIENQPDSECDIENQPVSENETGIIHFLY